MYVRNKLKKRVESLCTVSSVFFQRQADIYATPAILATPPVTVGPPTHQPVPTYVIDEEDKQATRFVPSMSSPTFPGTNGCLFSLSERTFHK